jgi:hypothetical protein
MLLVMHLPHRMEKISNTQEAEGPDRHRAELTMTLEGNFMFPQDNSSIVFVTEPSPTTVS